MTARVLIVDDVPANLKLLEAKLMAEYFGVLQASSGPEALEVAVREKPDIILLDVMMPGMDGFEVCRRLRAMPETSHVPIIMVTALDQQKDRVEGLEAGADDFLTKPVDDVALFARVKSLVRLKMLTDELRMREETGQRIGLVGEDTKDGSVCRKWSNSFTRRPSAVTAPDCGNAFAEALSDDGRRRRGHPSLGLNV